MPAGRNASYCTGPVGKIGGVTYGAGLKASEGGTFNNASSTAGGRREKFYFGEISKLGTGGAVVPGAGSPC